MHSFKKTSKGEIFMNINRTASHVPAQTAYKKSANAISQSSFSDVLKKTSAKDTFSSSAVSSNAAKVGSLSVAATQAKLDIISAELEKTDYSGMSKAEIYADIEKRFENTFDDYYASRVVFPCEDYIMVNNQFHEEIHNYVGYYAPPAAIVKEAKGYSGMTYEEIEASIKEKYAGKTGFVDQLNLLGELFTSGVLSNKYGWDTATDFVSKLDISIDMRSFNESILGTISKDEWLRRVEEAGVSSPFTLLLNAPYLSLAEKELFKTIVDDILFGIADKAE